MGDLPKSTTVYSLDTRQALSSCLGFGFVPTLVFAPGTGLPPPLPVGGARCSLSASSQSLGDSSWDVALFPQAAKGASFSLYPLLPCSHL
jgi:hypothetical protein